MTTLQIINLAIMLAFFLCYSYQFFYIPVDVIGGGNAFNVPLQIGEVRRQDRGCDLDHGGAPFAAPLLWVRHMIQ